MRYIDSPAAGGAVPHGVRPGTAPAGTTDAPVPGGRYRERRKPAGPDTVIARPGVAPALR